MRATSERAARLEPETVSKMEKPMETVIQTNVCSLSAQRTSASGQRTLSKGFEKLSSGLQINAAAGNAAGLATRGTNGALRGAHRPRLAAEVSNLQAEDRRTSMRSRRPQRIESAARVAGVEVGVARPAEDRIGARFGAAQVAARTTSSPEALGSGAREGVASDPAGSQANLKAGVSVPKPAIDVAHGRAFSPTGA